MLKLDVCCVISRFHAFSASFWPYNPPRLDPEDPEGGRRPPPTATQSLGVSGGDEKAENRRIIKNRAKYIVLGVGAKLAMSSVHLRCFQSGTVAVWSGVGR